MWYESKPSWMAPTGPARPPCPDLICWPHPTQGGTYDAQAEVRELGRAAAVRPGTGEQHVLWLDVPVEHLGGTNGGGWGVGGRNGQAEVPAGRGSDTCT